MNFRWILSDILNVFTNVKKIEKKEESIKLEDFLSIVCIAKNEGEYIKEWVDFHLLAGVDRIYLYDNESQDNMKNELEPYIVSGKVVYTYFPGKAKQLDAYNDAIKKYKYKTKYMAFIDADEFLLPENQNDDLKTVIDKIMTEHKHAGGIGVNWRVYGSSGYEKKPDGLIIENFTHRGGFSAPGNDCIKTIANPRLISEYRHVHYPKYVKNYYNVNEDGIRLDGWSNECGDTKYLRINHYFTKSKEEWIKRRSIGKADTKDNNDKRSIEEFIKHDRNEIYDPIMLKYVEKLKSNNE